MKKEYDKKKKLVIFILTAVAVCLAGGLCFYLVKIGTPKEPEKEPVQQVTEQMEVTVPEIDITKEPEALEETKSEAAEISGQETEQPESSESEYTEEEKSGPPHNPRYVYAVSVNGELLGRGEGASKIQAQADAAEQALKKLGIDYNLFNRGSK